MAGRLMKNSGVEWIGEIPNNWQLINLRYFIEEYKTGPFGSTLRIDKILTEGSPFENILIYSPEHVAKKEIYLQSNTYISEERREELSQFFVNEGDIVFPIVGSLGRSMEITSDMPEGIINSRLGKFKLKQNKLNKDYFMWLFSKSDFYKTYIDLNSHGAIIVNLTKDMFCNMPVPVPNYEEQIKIADFLDKKVSEIDNAIEKTKQSIEEYKKLKQSIITEAVTKGLNPDVEMRDSGNKSIGSIPHHWKIGKIKNVLLSIKDGTHGTFERTQDGQYLLSAKNVSERGIIIEDSDSKISQSDYELITSNGFPKKNDVLMCCVGTVGRTFVYDLDFPLAFQRSVSFLRCNELIKPFFLNYYLKTKSIEQEEDIEAKGTAQVGLYMSSVMSLPVVFPDVIEQQKIIDYLDVQCSKYDELITKKEQIITELEQYKKSLIYEYVTGKKEVA